MMQITYDCLHCDKSAEKERGYYDNSEAVLCRTPCPECAKTHNPDIAYWYDESGDICGAEVTMARWPEVV